MRLKTFNIFIMRKTSIIAAALSITLLTSSCLGSFSAFNGLKDWNQELTNSKFLNNLIFWGLNIIPVYGLFFVGDVLIFNTIEFWTGSNPLAMAEGDSETKVIVQNGNTYEMTATKNQLLVKVIDGKDLGNEVTFNYIPETQTWQATTQDGEVIKLSSLKEGKYIVYLPNGSELEMDADISKEEGLAIINSNLVALDCYDTYALVK